MRRGVIVLGLAELEAALRLAVVIAGNDSDTEKAGNQNDSLTRKLSAGSSSVKYVNRCGVVWCDCDVGGLCMINIC